jgi:AraC-like DNA-binding protein
MLGSQLFEQLPTFRGADFGIPEIAQLGAYDLRQGIATSDSWDQHDGPEILFLCAGEACWELSTERLAQVAGGQALIIPAGMRHRIVNGIYPPERAVWIVFAAREPALARPGLFSQQELEVLFQIARRQETPVALPDVLVRRLLDLARRLADERLLIGSTLQKAEIRTRIYAAVIEFWKLCAGGVRSAARSPIVRKAEQLLRQDLASDLSIDDIIAALGCGRSRLYALFRQEIGMSPNDYRLRLRIRHCCDRLSRGSDSVLQIAVDGGFGTSQYFSRVFRRYVGMAPLTYRRVIGGHHAATAARTLWRAPPEGRAAARAG